MHGVNVKFAETINAVFQIFPQKRFKISAVGAFESYLAVFAKYDFFHNVPKKIKYFVLTYSIHVKFVVL